MSVLSEAEIDGRALLQGVSGYPGRQATQALIGWPKRALSHHGSRVAPTTFFADIATK
jgi:hypothetical protein